MGGLRWRRPKGRASRQTSLEAARAVVAVGVSHSLEVMPSWMALGSSLHPFLLEIPPYPAAGCSKRRAHARSGVSS